MALPNSGRLSLSQVQQEIGLTNPAKLSNVGVTKLSELYGVSDYLPFLNWGAKLDGDSSLWVGSGITMYDPGYSAVDSRSINVFECQSNTSGFTTGVNLRSLTFFTVSAWFFLPSSAEGQGINHPFFDQFPSTTHADRFWVITDYSGTNFQVRKGSYKVNGGAVKYGSWFHLCLVKTSAQYNLYMDGILIATLNISGLPASMNLRFFQQPYSSIKAMPGAKVGDARIYSTALSTPQISQIYNYGKLFYPN